VPYTTRLENHVAITGAHVALSCMLPCACVPQAYPSPPSRSERTSDHGDQVRLPARDETSTFFHDAFDSEFHDLPEDIQDEVLAHARLLEEFGPNLGRPRVDTLKGSRHANMKELRFDTADGGWRVAFDPQRRAILLVCGDKSGGSERRFYRQLIRKTDDRFDDHLSRLRKRRRES
jgi:hypothetical protein